MDKPCFEGNNELRMNIATLTEAVQEYLDRRFSGVAPRVSGMAFGADGSSSVLVVHLDSSAKAATP